MLSRPAFRKSFLIISLVILIDQAVKIYIKTTMYLGQEYRITDWFFIHFTENNGMAFGFEFEGAFGKLFLSFFRIAALAVIGFYLFRTIRRNDNPKWVTALSLVFAGALGNIIDSVFYGKIFSGSEFSAATMFPADGGYASWFHGKVVDMLYFPLLSGTFPTWVPIWGGEYFIFFRPVFNIADSSITCGMLYILLFQKQIFHVTDKNQTVRDHASPTASEKNKEFTGDN